MQTVQTRKRFPDLKWVQRSRKTVPQQGYSFLGTSATTTETSVEMETLFFFQTL